METPVGDFDMDEVLDVGDIDVLTERIYLGYVDSNGYWADTMFDLNGERTSTSKTIASGSRTSHTLGTATPTWTASSPQRL